MRAYVCTACKWIQHPNGVRNATEGTVEEQYTNVCIYSHNCNKSTFTAQPMCVTPNSVQFQSSQSAELAKFEPKKFRVRNSLRSVHACDNILVFS